MTHDSVPSPLLAADALPATHDVPGIAALRPSRSPDSLYALTRLAPPDELSVVFQPIVAADTLKVFAHEALLRCRTPGFTDPSVLFARALQDGFCGRLGRAMREIAVPLSPSVPLFLNVHPQELHEPWLMRPDDPIYFHDHVVYLEITESVPLLHFELCRDVLRAVRARANVQLVVDDLGAGYSNLARIADLEPALVKLDRGLVTNIAANPRRRQLVAGVVRLCQDLGARVVAEGIETRDECAALRDTGVHYLQGFLFARPAFPPPSVDPGAVAPRQGG